MNEVTPWISDYFLNLATVHGSSFDTVPPTEKLKKCQLKRVLTPQPEDYFWVVLSDTRHEVHGRIPKEVLEAYINGANRDKRYTRHVGSVIYIRNFTPLLFRGAEVEGVSARTKVLGLEIGKVKLPGGAGESIWGTPQPLDSIPELKEWIQELRKPSGNRDILKIRKEQQDEAKAVEQLNGPSVPSPDPELHPQSALHAPAVAIQKAASTVSTVSERSPMQRYRRKWHKAVPGLDEFAHILQIPEDVRLSILEKEKETDKKAKAKPRLSARGALEIGSSPARLSSVPRPTTPKEWPASPGVLNRLYNDHETDMSSDVYSTRQSSPIDVYQDAEMDEVEAQHEPETVPETPQATLDSQPQRLSPPPPAQPPRPRSPLPSSSNPQGQNSMASPESNQTSMQAVSGSQLPSSGKQPAWARLDDVPSNGPSFELPGSQHDNRQISAPKLTPEANSSPEKQVAEPPSSIGEPALPVTTNHPQGKSTAAKKVSRTLAFGECVVQAVELAFQEGDPEKVVSTAHGPPVALPIPKVDIIQLPPPKPRSKPPSKVTQKSLPGPSPSPLDRLAEANHPESPVRHPFQTLNRKVPVPEVGPTREPVRGRNENGVPTMVLVPASDDTKLSSPLKQSSSSQPVQSSQSIPLSQPIPPSKHNLPSQTVPSSEPQIQHSVLEPDQSISHEGDSVVVHVNETVADVETIQDAGANTQSSLEYASTQDCDGVAVAAEASKPVDQPVEVEVAKEKVADKPAESLLPQIAVIHEVESQQSAVVENEEVDELEDDSGAGSDRPVVKRKAKPASKSPSKSKRTKPKESKKPTSSKARSKPPSRDGSVIEKASLRSSSKLPPKPVVVIERKRTPVVQTDDRVFVTRKRQLSALSEEGFPAPQPIKRSRVHEQHPVKDALSPIPRTPSPLPREEQNSAVPVVSRSVKGKERAEGIKGLENINVSKDTTREEAEVVQVQAKKKAPDTGSKRKPSDAFSAQDDSRDTKRPKVAKEPEARKLTKQLSFVDPDKLKRPFRSRPQAHKTSAQHQTTATAESSTSSRPNNDERTSKYFNPQLYREPAYPRITTTPEAEPPQKVVNAKSDARKKGAVGEGSRNSGDPRPQIDSRKTRTSDSERRLPEESRKGSRVRNNDGRSVAPARVQFSEPDKEDGEEDSIVTELSYPPARKLGSFTPDLNPPLLSGLPGGRLTNKRLREILIRTGKVRVREAKAAELNQKGQ